MNVQALDDKGRFYLIYTDVKSFIGSFKDTHNYLVTAEDIHGPWSEPIYLNSSGFDPSLFHDRDGRKYLVNMVMDHRSYSASKFAGIVLQEYSEAERKLVGPKKVIFKASGRYRRTTFVLERRLLLSDDCGRWYWLSPCSDRSKKPEYRWSL